jgi:hypothetical protein
MTFCDIRQLFLNEIGKTLFRFTELTNPKPQESRTYSNTQGYAWQKKVALPSK